MPTTIMGLSPRSSNIIVEIPEILELIESQSWTEIIRKLQDEPSDASLQLDSSTGQSNLAIHEACKHQPPVAVIDSLIKANPGSVMTKGQWGYLPIHFACSTGASNKVVTKLINANPACARIRDEHEHRLPLHIAAKWGAAQDVVLTIMTHHPEGVYIRDAAGKTPMDYAKALPAHRKMEVVKALKQGPLLSAVSKAAMERASTTESLRDSHPEETSRSIPVGSVPVTVMEARLKEEKANSEKAYASIIGKMETRHKREVELAKAEAEARKKVDETQLLRKIEEAEVVASSERKARAALELMYEAEVVTAKEEAEKHKEELTVSNRKVQELTSHADTLSMSSLPLRQKLKSLRADLEQEWEKNRVLTEENEVLNASKQKVDAELSEQTKNMESMKGDLADKTDKVASHEALIVTLQESISSKESHVEQLVATMAGLETELDEQEKVIDKTNEKLLIANDEVQSNKAAIADLKDQISVKDKHAQGLDKTIASLESDLDYHKKKNDTLTSRADGSIHVIECNEATIAELKEVISKKDKKVEVLTGTIERLETALVHQEKEISVASDELLAARDEIKAKEATIGVLKDDNASKETLAENLEATISGLETTLAEQEKVTEVVDSKLVAANDDIKAKEDAIEALKDEIVKKETLVDSLGTTIAGLEATNEEMKAKVETIAELKDDISNKDSLAENLRATVAGLEAALIEQEKEWDDANEKLRSANDDIEAKESTIDELKKEVSFEVRHAQGLAVAIATLESDLDSQKKENDSLVTKIDGATHVIESHEIAIADLKNEISDKQAQIEDFQSTITNLGVEVNDHKKATETTATKLHAAIQEIEAKDKAIADIKYDLSEKEARVIELKQELADAMKDVESKHTEIQERDRSIIDIVEENKQLEEVKSRLHVATEEILLKASMISTIEAQHSEKDLKCNELSKELEDLIPKLESETERSNTLSQQASDLALAKTSLELELKEAIVDLEVTKEKLADAMADIEGKTAKISELDGVVTVQRTGFHEMSAAMDTLQLEHKNEQDRAGALEETIQSLESEKMQLQGELKNKEEEVDKVKSRMFDLIEDVDVKSSKINGLEVLLANEESRSEELTAELEEIKTQLQNAKTQLAELNESISSLEAAKETLETSLSEKKAALEETENALNSTTEEREAKIAENLMLEGLLSDKYSEIEEFGEQLKIKQVEADRAVILEKQVDTTTNELLKAQARSDELQLDIAQLNNKLTTAQVEIKKYKMRAKTVEKWVSSFALSIQGWRLEADNQEELLITATSTDMVSEVEEP